MDELVAIKKEALPTATEVKTKATPEVKEKAMPKVEERAELKTEGKTESEAQETEAHKRKSGRSYCAISALRGQLIIGEKGLIFDETDTNAELRIICVDNVLATAITDGMLLCTEALFYLDEKSLGDAALVGIDTGDYQQVGKYDAMRHISLPEEGEMRISGRVLSLSANHFRIRIGNNWLAGKNKNVPRIRVSSAPPSGWKKGEWIEETLIRAGSKWHLKT